MKNKKYLFMSILFLIIIFLTYYNIFNKNDIDIVFHNLGKLSVWAVLLCILIIVIYFLLHALYMKITLNSLKVNISFFKCIFYYLVEFYFSGITPSSTGGQPVELYYMSKDNIPIRKSYITLMLNTIYFKIIIIALGITSFFFIKPYLLNNIIYLVFFILGLIVDIILTILFLLLIFKQSFIKKVITAFVKKFKKIKFLNNRFKNFNINSSLTKYKNELVYIKNNKKIVVIDFFITLIQRILLFSIAYIIYRSFGFTKYSYIDLLMIQVSVQVAIEALPLPGGSGLSENMFKTMFITVFGINLSNIAMIFTRTFSFYIPLIASGIIILIDKIIKKAKNIRKT